MSEPGFCSYCGAKLVPAYCWVCGGNGYIPGDEFDPINYSQFEVVECAACHGAGEMGETCPFCVEE